MVVQPSDKLSLLSATNITASCSSDQAGRCKVDARLPLEWFDTDEASGGNFVNVGSRWADGPLITRWTTVATHPRPPVAPATGSIVVSVPEHTLYPDELLTVTVAENFDVPLAGYQMRLSVEQPLRAHAVSIVSVNVDTAQWEGSQVSVGAASERCSAIAPPCQD